jgi:hypothetical protein
MGGQAGPFSVVYSYDAQGRVSRMRRQIFNHEDVIETTYNEHSDKVTETTRGIQIVSEEEKITPGIGLPAYSEVHFSYRYDDRGNWTEQDVSYRSSPGGALESSTGRRRALTYY